MGKEHLAISGLLLRSIQRRAAAAGIELDIGEIPSYTGMDATPDDPTRPARILAHAVARAADRVPPLRKLSRHIEGTENKAGLGSDLLSAAFDLYARNQEQFEAMLRQYSEGVARKRAQGKASENGGVHRSRFSRGTKSPPQQEVVSP